MRTLVLLARFMFSSIPAAVVHYSSPSMVWLLILSFGLIVVSFVISFWRKRLQNAVTRKLSSSWSSATFWFGIVGLLLVVGRVERIQVVGMPFLWVIWGVIFLVYIGFQVRNFRSKHYEVLPRAMQVDPMDKYLPKRKK